jgi:predicted RNA polymerase sigma factor
MELSDEAIRLARLVRRLLPDNAEVAGLLALMILTDARRAARTGPNGELIPLDQQDRARWDQRAISEGVGIISETLPKGHIGPYQLQAAIAAVHDEAPSTDETDWEEILALYGVLKQMSDNPMVSLNHAVANAMVHGPRAGARIAGPACRRSAIERSLSSRCRTRSPLRARRRPSKGRPALSGGRGPNDQHP